MTTLSIHQALYGYDDGHRLIVASRPLQPESQRALRHVTDMAFDGQEESYVTVFPLPEESCQALIRSWPAGSAKRPGSVWSHVLLVSFIDLGALLSLEPLLTLFRRPSRVLEERPKELRTSYGLVVDLPLPGGHGTAGLSQSIAETLVSAVYGSPTLQRVVIAKPSLAEAALFGIFEQQWPRLRRQFSFRTRSRASSGGAVRFDLEVVQRAANADAVRTRMRASWQQTVVADLINPDPGIRQMLRLFGAESSDGLRDLPPLLTLLADIRQGESPETVSKHLSAWFPKPEVMPKLKQALFGRQSEPSASVTGWSADEVTRLSLLLTASSSAVSYRDLNLRSRLVAAWPGSKERLRPALAGVNVSNLSAPQVAVLVEAMAMMLVSADGQVLTEIEAPLALLVLGDRPDLLSTPDLWTRDSSRLGHLYDLVLGAGAQIQGEVLAMLATRGELSFATRLVGLQPELWWRALRACAAAASTHEELLQSAKYLRRIIDPTEIHALGAPDWKLNRDELVIVAAAGSSDGELWGLIDQTTWIEVAEKLPVWDGSGSSADWTVTQVRVLTLALAAGISSGGGSLRRRAWLAVFGELNELLAVGAEDSESGGILDRILPAGPTWDRCSRLRDGLIDEITHDQWTDADVALVLSRAGKYTHPMYAQLAKRKRARSRGWLERILNPFDW